MAQDCILVGNGTSVLDREAGDQIDQFDTVVRFNQFHLGKFIPYVGSKTDIWFMVLPPVNATWRINQPLRHLYVHSWAINDKLLPLYRALNPPFQVSKLNLAHIEEMEDFIGVKYPGWSTGALAIWEMLKHFPQVTITGFDWWEKKGHHYFDNGTRGDLHKPQVEKMLIDKLQEEGKLQFL